MFELMPDSVAVLTRNICDLLRHAGEPVNLQTIAAVVRTMPLCKAQLMDEHWRNQYCSHCMEKASDGGEQSRRLVEYFVTGFRERPEPAKQAVMRSLEAVLAEIDAGMKADRV